MDYKARIDQIIDYIGHHLDDDIDIDHLANMACFSRSHLQRLFREHLGLSIPQFIKWMRLKRAAHQLLVCHQESILSIALGAGFESHESFTRAFKQTCGCTPSEFRKNSFWSDWPLPPMIKDYLRTWQTSIDVECFDTRVFAYLPDITYPHLEMRRAWLQKWLNLHKNDDTTPAEILGFTTQDPSHIQCPNLRMSLGFFADQETKIDATMQTMTIPAGRFVTTRHLGDTTDIHETIAKVYQTWLPTSGETLGPLPCLFFFKRFAHRHAEIHLETQLQILLQD